MTPCCARDQLRLLEPLAETLDAHAVVMAQLADLTAIDRALPTWFDERLRSLLLAEVSAADVEIDRLTSAIERSTESAVGLDQQRTELSIQIAGAGGDRLAAIDAETAQLDGAAHPTTRPRGLRTRQSHRSASPRSPMSTGSRRCRQASPNDATSSMPSPPDPTPRHRIWNRNVGRSTPKPRRSTRSCAASGSAGKPAATIHRDPRRALSGARRRGRAAAVRRRAAPGPARRRGLGRDRERVLRRVRHVALVPEEHYGSVATWVDAQHLGAKLVYHRVPDRLGRRADTGRSGTAPLLLTWSRLAESKFADWLTNELWHRADHECVDTIEAFRRSPKP